MSDYLTRRTFLGTAAATATLASTARAAADDKLVVGIMGTGGRGTALAAVRGTAKPNSEIAEGATSTLLCHLGNIAHRTGRTLHCNPKTGTIENDPEAMKLWSKEYAVGWEPKV